MTIARVGLGLLLLLVVSACSTTPYWRTRDRRPATPVSPAPLDAAEEARLTCRLGGTWLVRHIGPEPAPDRVRWTFLDGGVFNSSQFPQGSWTADGRNLHVVVGADTMDLRVDRLFDAELALFDYRHSDHLTWSRIGAPPTCPAPKPGGAVGAARTGTAPPGVMDYGFHSDVEEPVPDFESRLGLDGWLVQRKIIPGLLYAGRLPRFSVRANTGLIFNTKTVERFGEVFLGAHFGLRAFYHPFRTTWLDTRIGGGATLLWLGNIDEDLFYGGLTLTAGASVDVADPVSLFVEVDFYPWRSSGFQLDVAPIVARVGVEVVVGR